MNTPLPRTPRYGKGGNVQLVPAFACHPGFIRRQPESVPQRTNLHPRTCTPSRTESGPETSDLSSSVLERLVYLSLNEGPCQAYRSIVTACLGRTVASETTPPHTGVSAHSYLFFVCLMHNTEIVYQTDHDSGSFRIHSVWLQVCISSKNRIRCLCVLARGKCLQRLCERMDYQGLVIAHGDLALETPHAATVVIT